MSGKPTPGLWIACGGWVEHPDENTADICNCDPEAMGQEYLGRSYETICANALLIAAAPDLLEALRACEAWIADGGHAEDGSGREVYLAARAALSKAEGRE